MKLDFNLQIKQKQGLALTAQVQQAIKLLHMTNMEIQEYVSDQFQDNPFVEANNLTDETISKDTLRDRKKEIDQTFQDAPYSKQETENKIAIENQFETGDGYIPRSTVAKAESNIDTISLIKASDKSLYSHCVEFLNTLKLNAAEHIIALKLIDELEPTGWLAQDLSAIAAELDCSVEMVEIVLKNLQEIEPAGLFSRNLKECLALQAKEAEVYNPNLATVLDNLHLIASGKFDLLKRRSGCSDPDLSEIFKTIKSFNPKPGLQFDSIDVPIREPDLSVKETEDGWIVELNNSTLPAVKVEKEYAQVVRKKVTEKKDREFIQDKIAEAKWLSKAIEKRNDTMIKVGSEIVKRQRSFLESGIQYIKPMVLKDIAEAVGMHESTISRVTTGSLMQTPQGTLELKAFFSVGLQQEDRESTSATSIKYKIKKLVETEDPCNPVSDDAIVETLSKEGITLARRTVAKYRKAQNIPSSFARKRRNVLTGSMA
jgi:RNA polymerase sigma-54 factor